MSDAFQGARAGVRATQSRGYGMAVVLPNIPAWVPAEAKQSLAKLILRTIRLVLQTAAGHISSRAPVGVTGHLAQSFGADPATRTGGLELFGVDLDAGIGGRIFSSLPYAVVMEEGRRPGAPISRAGIDAIGLWAQRVLGLSAEEADDAKWAIAHTIVAQGIPGKAFVEDGWNATRPMADRLFADLSQDIVDALTEIERGR